MALSLSVTKRRPEKLISIPAQHILGEFRNPRVVTLEDAIIEPISKTLMLEPLYNPTNYPWGKASYRLVGSASTNFLDLTQVFGREGKHVCHRVTNDSTEWAAYLEQGAAQIQAFRGFYFAFFWYRPPSSVTYPRLDFFPRLNLNHQHPTTADYLTPIGFRIDGNNNFDVYELGERTLCEWDSEPDPSLDLQYRHELASREQVIGPYNRWLTMWIQPLDEEQFIVSADWLRDGGFLYHSTIEHDFDLFPEGSAGIRSPNGGGAMWQICPCEYETDGHIISQEQTRLVADTTYPTNTLETYMGTNTIAGVSLLDEDDAVISSGDEIDTWKYKVTLQSSDGKDTPRVFRVEIDWQAELEAPAAASEDVSSDVVALSLNIGADSHGREGTLKLRNPNTPGDYDDWLLEPRLRFDCDIHGEDLVTLYSDNPSFEMWRIATQPEREIPIIEWEVSDRWRLLYDEIIVDAEDYGGQQLSVAITNLLTWAGWESADLDIDTCTVTLPDEKKGGRARNRPPDGARVADVLQQWHRDYAANWTMRISRDNKFQFKEPGTVSIGRTFYRSLSEGSSIYDAAYQDWTDGGAAPEDEPQASDYAYAVEKGMKVTVNTRDFYNEIWVVGEDERTGKPITALHLDPQSMNDPTYENYVGQRKLAIYVNPALNRQDKVDWVLAELVKFAGDLRKQVAFKARFDPTLLPNDYIKIHGMSETWRVLTVNPPIERGNVVPRLDRTIHCDYVAEEWPTEAT